MIVIFDETATLSASDCILTRVCWESKVTIELLVSNNSLDFVRIHRSLNQF